MMKYPLEVRLTDARLRNWSIHIGNVDMGTLERGWCEAEELNALFSTIFMSTLSENKDGSHHLCSRLCYCYIMIDRSVGRINSIKGLSLKRQ